MTKKKANSSRVLRWGQLGGGVLNSVVVFTFICI